MAANPEILRGVRLFSVMTDHARGCASTDPPRSTDADQVVNGAVANRTENCLHQMTTLRASLGSMPAGTS